MKPFDKWTTDDVIEATHRTIQLRDTVVKVGGCLDGGCEEYADRIGSYFELVETLDGLFGEDWLQWLDVDAAPGDAPNVE